MDSMEKLAILVIQRLDATGQSNSWLRKVVDLIANHGYTDLNDAKIRANELHDWESRINEQWRELNNNQN